MHPVFIQALASERVREARSAAAARQQVKLARQARRTHSAGAATAAHPVAVLRSLNLSARHHEPPRHAGHSPRRAA